MSFSAPRALQGFLVPKGSFSAFKCHQGSSVPCRPFSAFKYFQVPSLPLITPRALECPEIHLGPFSALTSPFGAFECPSDPLGAFFLYLFGIAAAMVEHQRPICPTGLNNAMSLDLERPHREQKALKASQGVSGHPKPTRLLKAFPVPAPCIAPPVINSLCTLFACRNRRRRNA